MSFFSFSDHYESCYNTNMLEIKKEELINELNEFTLPLYDEIPDTGLYLDQVVRYINSYLESFTQPLTSNMVSNYVKKKIIKSPNKKQYGRDHILYLIMITLCKPVMSLEQILQLFEIQRFSYDTKTAYNYFYLEFYNNLKYVFGLNENKEVVGIETTDEKLVFKNAIITVCQKIYIDHLFNQIKKSKKL